LFKGTPRAVPDTGDHGLLTPWAATGRRKAVVGPHRRGGGAHDEPTRGNNSWQRLTSRYERRHRRHPTQAPPGEGPKGPGRARSGEAGVRSEPRRPGDDGHHQQHPWGEAEEESRGGCEQGRKPCAGVGYVVDLDPPCPNLAKEGAAPSAAAGGATRPS
jgi:hypothetical protein